MFPSSVLNTHDPIEVRGGVMALSFKGSQCSISLRFSNATAVPIGVDQAEELHGEEVRMPARSCPR